MCIRSDPILASMGDKNIPPSLHLPGSAYAYTQAAAEKPGGHDTHVGSRMGGLLPHSWIWKPGKGINHIHPSNRRQILLRHHRPRYTIPGWHGTFLCSRREQGAGARPHTWPHGRCQYSRRQPAGKALSRRGPLNGKRQYYSYPITEKVVRKGPFGKESVFWVSNPI